MAKEMILGLIAALLGWGLTQSALADDAPQTTFAGIKFGVGIAVARYGGSQIVNSAQVSNGVVQVTSTQNTAANVVLEVHHFFQPGILGLENCQRCGWGPFLAIQPGSDNIIQSVGFGWMIGLGSKDSHAEGQSFNIGIGAIVQPKAQTLADGFANGQTPPNGATSVAFKEVTKAGPFITFSFVFY